MSKQETRPMIEIDDNNLDSIDDYRIELNLSRVRMANILLKEAIQARKSKEVSRKS